MSSKNLTVCPTDCRGNKENAMKETQCKRIVQYIKDFGSITSAEAVNELGCHRLASRICDLKKQGYSFKGEMIARKNRYGETVHFKRYSFDEE